MAKSNFLPLQGGVGEGSAPSLPHPALHSITLALALGITSVSGFPGRKFCSSSFTGKVGKSFVPKVQFFARGRKCHPLSLHMPKP